MARRTGRPRARTDVAAKLIGVGLVLGLGPLAVGSSPLGAALKPLASFGWVALAVGCGMLWWQLRAPRVRPASVDRTRAKNLTSPAPGAQKWSAAIFNVIEWRRFEAVVEALFAQAGFETKAQSHGADEGVDIWLYSASNPGFPVSLVQCKHWQGKVGVDKVRELRGVMAAKNVRRGQFATTSTFTPDAVAFAEENGINLLDVQGLLALIATRAEDQQDALLAVALEGEYWKPTCVNCGIKMVERTPRTGGAAFWGCASYPKCTKRMPMRVAMSGWSAASSQH